MKPIQQYSLRAVLAVWAAAAVPMGLLAWVIVPAVAGERPFEGLVIGLTVGLVWQFLLVLGLVYREQRSLRWHVLREALWLRPPQDANGRRGGRVWWWALVFLAGAAVLQLIPLTLPAPASHDLEAYLGSAQGRETLSGNWGLYLLIVVMLLFNTVLGEELLFRGLLLPRMAGAFGRADWVANGILAGLYHLHQPWSIPRSIITHSLLYAYGVKKFKSAWLGIIVHSSSSVFIAIVILAIVVS